MGPRGRGRGARGERLEVGGASGADAGRGFGRAWAASRHYAGVSGAAEVVAVQGGREEAAGDDSSPLSGRAAAPEAWTLEIEKEALFETVRLTSVFDKENEDMRRFELNFNVVWKGADLE